MANGLTDAVDLLEAIRNAAGHQEAAEEREPDHRPQTPPQCGLHELTRRVDVTAHAAENELVLAGEGRQPSVDIVVPLRDLGSETTLDTQLEQEPAIGFLRLLTQRVQ